MLRMRPFQMLHHRWKPLERSYCKLASLRHPGPIARQLLNCCKRHRGMHGSCFRALLPCLEVEPFARVGVLIVVVSKHHSFAKAQLETSENEQLRESARMPDLLRMACLDLSSWLNDSSECMAVPRGSGARIFLLQEVSYPGQRYLVK